MNKKYLFIIIITLIFTSLHAQQTVTEQWASRYNGPGNNYDEATSVAVDAFGNVFVCGGSTGTAGGQDIAVVKYSPAGAQMWAQRYNGSGNDFDDGYKLILDNLANVYVIGTSTGNGSGQDGILLKYNSSGTFQWEGRYTGPSDFTDEFYSVEVDASYNVYVTGYSNGDTTGDDVITIKYNSSGVQQWARRYNGPINNDDYGNQVVLDASGNVYVAAAHTGDIADLDFLTIKYDNNGNQQWIAAYNGPGNGPDFPSSCAIDLNSGSLYVVGYSAQVGTGASDYTLIKYNLSGQEQWVRTYNGPANGADEAYSVIIDVAGAVYITGNSQGQGTMDDYATVKYSSAGVQQWAARYDGTGNDDYANYFAVDVAGNVYVTGLSWGGASKEDIVTIKYNFDGNTVWTKRFNGPGNDYDNGNAIAIDDAGNIYIAAGSESAQLTTDFLAIKYNQVTGIQNISGEVPSRYSLSQNYPNPFNPSTKIQFSIPEPGMVKLAVFDITGKEVGLLVNSNLKTGRYEYEWNAGKLTSGIYFYRLQTDNFSEVKRMILIK
jgi:hypothetical protein